MLSRETTMSRTSTLTSDDERRWRPATALRRLRLRIARRRDLPSFEDEVVLTPLTRITPFVTSRRGSHA
jgi:hypothetical protein